MVSTKCTKWKADHVKCKLSVYILDQHFLAGRFSSQANKFSSQIDLAWERFWGFVDKLTNCEKISMIMLVEHYKKIEAHNGMS